MNLLPMLGAAKAAVRNAFETERAKAAAVQIVGNEALYDRLKDEAERLSRTTTYSFPEAWLEVARRYWSK